jgi:hypothetical protein
MGVPVVPMIYLPPPPLPPPYHYTFSHPASCLASCVFRFVSDLLTNSTSTPLSPLSPTLLGRRAVLSCLYLCLVTALLFCCCSFSFPSSPHRTPTPHSRHATPRRTSVSCRCIVYWSYLTLPHTPSQPASLTCRVFLQIKSN